MKTFLERVESVIRFYSSIVPEPTFEIRHQAKIRHALCATFGSRHGSRPEHGHGKTSPGERAVLLKKMQLQNEAPLRHHDSQAGRGAIQHSCGGNVRVSPVSTSSYVAVIKSFGVLSERPHRLRPIRGGPIPIPLSLENSPPRL